MINHNLVYFGQQYAQNLQLRQKENVEESAIFKIKHASIKSHNHKSYTNYAHTTEITQ